MIVAFDCWNECQSFRGEEFVISPAMSEAVESLLIALVGDSVAEMLKVFRKRSRHNSLKPSVLDKLLPVEL